MPELLTIEAKAPGKLMLAGEWAILEPGNTAIVAAVNRFVKVQIKKLTQEKSLPITIRLIFPNFKIDIIANLNNKKLEFTNLNPDTLDKLKFVRSAIETILEIAPLSNSLEIITDSSETIATTSNNNQKIGFGSSAAVTVATIKALVELLEVRLQTNKEDLIFKLSAIAHFRAQGKIGSAFDIAAAVYAETISYSRFDPNWLENKLANNSLINTLESSWKDLLIETLSFPNDLKILIGFTGKSASTIGLVKSMEEAIKNNPSAIRALYQQINQNTLKLIKTIKNKEESEKIYQLINFNQKLLKSLTESSTVEVVTDKLNKLALAGITAGTAAKLSGAGGGDCGFAIYQSINQKNDILKQWQEHGIDLVDTHLLK